MSYKLIDVPAINKRLELITGHCENCEDIHIKKVKENLKLYDYLSQVDTDSVDVGRVIAAMDKFEEALHTLSVAHLLVDKD